MPGPFTLTDDHFVAKGGGRLVFQHPTQPDHLIKVVRPERLSGHKPSKDTLFRRVTRPLSREHRRFGPYREWFREHEEYLAIMNRMRALPDFLPRYHGFVETDRGLGMVVEKITAPDGSVAPNLHHLLRMQGSGPPLAPMVEELFDRVGAAEAVLKDVSNKNIALGTDPLSGGLRLVVIDGLSDATTLRLKTWSGAAYRHWLRRCRATVLARVGAARCPVFTAAPEQQLEAVTHAESSAQRT